MIINHKFHNTNATAILSYIIHQFFYKYNVKYFNAAIQMASFQEIFEIEVPEQGKKDYVKKGKVVLQCNRLQLDKLFLNVKNKTHGRC